MTRREYRRARRAMVRALNPMPRDVFTFRFYAVVHPRERHEWIMRQLRALDPRRLP